MEKKKTVWFLNQNSYMPEDGPHIRHYTFGKYLSREGYTPFVFAANELHHVGTNIGTGGKKFLEKKAEGVHFFYIKTIPYKKNDFRRILNILSYYFRVFQVCDKVAQQYGKPDIIYASNMYPTTLVAGIKLAKKYGVKCICENRDLIPEGFVTKGTFKEHGLIYKALSRWMKSIYYKSDMLVFTMSGGQQYIMDHKWNLEQGGEIDLSKVYYINNGVDLEVAKKNAQDYVLEDSELDNPEYFKVVYFGAIRFLNQMPLFIETAKKLKENGYDKIKILLWGNGTKLEEMQEQLRIHGLDNIVLKGYVEKKYIPSIANRADLFIGTGNSCIVEKYGMSFNKLFDYLAGGKPVILPFKVAESILVDSGAGIEIDAATGETLAKEIVRFFEMPVEEYMKYCQSAKEVVKKYDYAVLSKKVMQVIDEALNS